jgi:hypothetical protein
MNEEESRPWTVKDDKSLEEIRQSLLDSLGARDIWCDLFMDRIANVQDRLYKVLLYLPQWRNLVCAKRTGRIKEISQKDGRITAFVDSMYNECQWEKVYGEIDEKNEFSEPLKGMSLQPLRNGIIHAVKRMEFEIIRDAVETVEDEDMLLTLKYLHEWRKLLQRPN